MYFYKVLGNKYVVTGSSTTYLYGGANINMIEVAYFDSNIMIIATQENIQDNDNIKKITKEQFEMLQKQIEEENKRKTENTQPNQQDIINAKLLKDNANMQIELNKQKELNANLLIQIAKLGGSANA